MSSKRTVRHDVPAINQALNKIRRELIEAGWSQPLLTIVVNEPGDAESWIVRTNDTYPEIRAILNRAEARETA